MKIGTLKFDSLVRLNQFFSWIELSMNDHLNHNHLVWNLRTNIIIKRKTKNCNNFLCFFILFHLYLNFIFYKYNDDTFDFCFRCILPESIWMVGIVKSDIYKYFACIFVFVFIFKIEQSFFLFFSLINLVTFCILMSVKLKYGPPNSFLATVSIVFTFVRSLNNQIIFDI